MTPAPAPDRPRLAGRGYVPLYRPGESNCCPACHGAAWHLGRQSAECARCATAVPFARPPIEESV